MKVWWVWEVGLTGEGKEERRRDAGAIAEEFRRRHSPVTPTSPKGYAAKGASAALPPLDDARGRGEALPADAEHPVALGAGSDELTVDRGTGFLALCGATGSRQLVDADRQRL